MILGRFFFIFFVVSEIYSLGGIQTGFCNGKNLNQFCGIQVKEKDIDSGFISPYRSCEGIFLWVPKRKYTIENCFICAETTNFKELEKFVSNTKKNKCGKMIKVNPKRIAPE